MSEKTVDTESATVPPSSTELPASDDIGFPEGGWQAWSTALGASLVQFTSFGYTNAFGVYQGYFYVREYLTTSSPSAIGWIGGVQIFLIFAAGVVTGRAFDRGYFHHMMIGGALLHVFSFFMLSLSHENQYYQVFLAQGLGGGLSTGLMYIPSLAIVSHYFHYHRALAMGIVSGGTALGAVIHPILLNKLIHGPIGFHNGVRISTGLNTVLFIIANLVMRTRLPPTKKSNGSSVPLVAFARDTPYLFAVFGGLLVLCGLFFPPFFLQLDAVKHGVDRDFAFYCISIMNAASFVGRVVPTIFAPRCGVFNMLIFFTYAMAALLFAMGGLTNAAGFTVFAVLFGFFSGGAIAITPPMLASLAKDTSEIGVRIGISFAISGILGLVATPIAGALLTTDFHWWRPILFSAITMFGSASCFLVPRYILARRKATQII